MTDNLLGGYASDIFHRMEELQPNWDSYGAEPPSKEAMDAAKRFLDALLRAKFQPRRIAPSVINGVGMSFWTSDPEGRDAYAEFYNSHPERACCIMSWETEEQAAGHDPRTFSFDATDAGFAVAIGKIRAWLERGEASE